MPEQKDRQLLRLLRADEAALEQLAELLLEPGPLFVLIVCRPALRPLAREFLAQQLRAVVLRPAVVLISADEVLTHLTHVAQHGADEAVWSFEFASNGLDESLRALNWHREKLVAHGRTIVWLDDLEQLRALREVAPDAYSFRETLLLLRGDELEEHPLLTENEPVARARAKVDRATNPIERAAALNELALTLGHLGIEQTARRIAEQAVAELANEALDREQDSSRRLVRAELMGTLGILSNSEAERATLFRGALAELGSLETLESHQLRCTLLARLPGPLDGTSLDATATALECARGLPRISAADLEVILRARAQCLAQAGDFQSASALMNESMGLASDSHSMRALSLRFRGWRRFEAGLTAAAEEDLREALSIGQGVESAAALIGLAECMCLRGELAAAERLVSQVRKASRGEPIEAAAAAVWSAQVASLRGETCAATSLIYNQLRILAELGYDRTHFHLVQALVENTQAAHDAGLIDHEQLRETVQRIAAEAEVSRALVGNAAPWFGVRFLSWQSDLLRDCDAPQDASARADQALALATSTCPDLAAFAASRVVACAIARGEATRATELIDRYEPPAAERHLLIDAARLSAQRVVALSKLDAREATIAAAMARVQAVTDQTGAPRTSADTWLWLGSHLPPSAADAITALDKALALYRDMQWPASEALALQKMGDVLAARARPVEAKAHYLSARARLLASEVRLPLPLLDRKLNTLATN